MTTWYRIQDADRDPADLLKPGNQVSRTWNPQQVTCSCQGLNPDCGRCTGSGWYTEPPRRGVSGCRSLSELCEYAEDAAMDLRDTVIVELEGNLSGDEDQDPGCHLICPSAVVSVTPVTEAEELRDQLAWDEANR
jgi:hypothetical protein